MMNKEKNFVSAVVYVHNAGKRIERFLGTILSVLEKNFEHSKSSVSMTAPQMTRPM